MTTSTSHVDSNPQQVLYNPNSSKNSNAPKVDDLYHFGEHDWHVLDVQNGQALLLSVEILKQKPYNKKHGDIWGDCTLRTYLNDKFFNKFSQADRIRIVETKIITKANLWYGHGMPDKDTGNVTTDKIFLLNLEEVDYYFGNSGDYHNQKFKQKYEWQLFGSDNTLIISNIHNLSRIASYSYQYSHWWLRSSGKSGYVAYVETDGSVNVYGKSSKDESGVRPALWINI